MRNHINIMRLPAEDFLRQHGLDAKESKKGNVTWHNFKICPICSKEGFQCGLSESLDAHGRSVKGFKCHHTGITDPKAFYEAIGYTGIRQPALTLMKHTITAKIQLENASSVDDLPRASTEAMAVYQKRLRENKGAMDYLISRGLTPETIEHFRLGLSKPYTSKDGVKSDNCLVYPLFNRRGEPVKKNAYYNIPGVTVNPKDQNGWMAGAVTSYFGGNPKGKALFICEGAKDLWALWPQIQGTPLEEELLLVTSTHGTSIPTEWQDQAFWQGFDQVYLGEDNDAAGERIVVKLVGMMGRDAARVRVPTVLGKDWTDFFQNGGTVADLQVLLSGAPPATVTVVEGDDLEQLGLVSYKPVDINGSFHGGHLHYTIRALNRKLSSQKNEDGSVDEVIQEALQTVVVRSDGAILTAMVQPIIKGVHQSLQVLRLTDGTLIAKTPAPSPYASWSWASIQRFCKAKTTGGRINLRPLALLVRQVLGYLKNQVWLPHNDDYVILALGVLATYVQTVFDAVPLFLVNGPKSSGKTELGRTVKEVCANAAMIGQGSAATIARLIDMTRGFVVLDDLESIGMGKVDAQFSELIQALKLSYKKTTASKVWTDTKTMKVEELNFFGIKMINNTTGVDAILGSRMFVIQTRKRLPQETEAWEASRTTAAGPPAGLRDELHTWAFEYCREVAATYQNMYSQGSERSDEIAAPLRVIAEMSGDRDLQSMLEAGLARQAARPKSLEDPVEILEEALSNVVIEGFREITVQHLVLEMKKLAPDNYGQERVGDIPQCFRAEWIGRQLRAHGWIEEDGGSTGRRVRVLGKNLRKYEVGSAFIASVASQLKKDGKQLILSPHQPNSFCQDCEGCQYRNVGCDMMPRRLDMQKAKSTAKRSGSR